MDLGPRLLTDLDDVTTLFERKLCSMGVLRLTLERTASAARLGHPEWVEPLSSLAERAAALEADGAPWIQGMALVDTVRRFVKQPTTPPKPVLSLVREEAAVAEAEDPEPEVAETMEPDPPAAPEAVPDDPIEPAMPSLMPRRTL